MSDGRRAPCTRCNGCLTANPTPFSAGAVIRARTKQCCIDVALRILFGLCGLALYVCLANVRRYDPLAPSRLERVRKALLDPADPRVLVCAHRGGSAPPENSLSAISQAIAMEADIVEVDTAETADGHIVLCHNRWADVTMNGHGEISKMTLKQVQALKLTRSIIGECAPTLETALRFAAGEVWLCLDMKKGGPDKIVAIVRKVGAMDRVIFYGNIPVLTRVRELAPEAILMAKIRRAEDLEGVMNRLRPQLVQAERDVLTADLSVRIRAAGAKPWVNSIGAPDWCAFLNLYLGYGRLMADAPGVVQADEPQLIRQFLLRRRMGLDGE